ncbi:hypothetical protein CTI12_AA292850 [Artemisia annua]|uniref:Uncharacterized protein n=1 Tax=Artemisia annua TaxID=35608 RepID=A0A2U1N913_ARTAN|nr:hypothetical protein CTI12_AA292850 [Artemisia annua]
MPSGVSFITTMNNANVSPSFSKLLVGLQDCLSITHVISPDCVREKKGSNLSTSLKQICLETGSGVTSKVDSSIKGVDLGGSKLHKSSNSSSKILLSILNAKLSSKSNKGFDIVTSKNLEIESELPKGSSDILGIGTGSLVGKLSISLGLKSISLSPIERVSICSPKGYLLSALSLICKILTIGTYIMVFGILRIGGFSSFVVKKIEH